MKSGLKRFGAALLGIAAFLAFAFTLQDRFGIPFDLTYRVACAAACMYLLGQIGFGYPNEQWPKIAFGVALVVNVALFFSPLGNIPASKGDILFFAAPDAVIFLTARIITFPVTDTHQRAVRQQMILGLVLALAFCAIILSMMLIPERPSRHQTQAAAKLTSLPRSGEAGWG